MCAVETGFRHRSRVVARDSNILQIDFNKHADPPRLKFLDGRALRGDQPVLQQPDYEIIRKFLATTGRKLDYFSLAQRLYC